jgi:hypothetical protein
MTAKAMGMVNITRKCLKNKKTREHRAEPLNKNISKENELPRRQKEKLENIVSWEKL